MTLRFGSVNFALVPMKNSQASAALRAARILLIDDNRNGLMVRKTVLEEQGYETEIASNGEDGLSKFQSHSFDLVVTDYRMPKMNGKEVIAEIRKVKKDMPVILVSGMVDPLGLNEQNTGADAVVAKTNNEVSHLLRAVTRLLKKSIKKPPASQNGAARKRKTV